jgi:hypothetical protein
VMAVLAAAALHPPWRPEQLRAQRSLRTLAVHATAWPPLQAARVRTCAWVIDSGAPPRTVNAISPPRPSSAASSACTSGGRVLDAKIGKP